MVIEPQALLMLLQFVWKFMLRGTGNFRGSWVKSAGEKGGEREGLMDMGSVWGDGTVLEPVMWAAQHRERTQCP